MDYDHPQLYWLDDLDVVSIIPYIILHQPEVLNTAQMAHEWSLR